MLGRGQWLQVAEKKISLQPSIYLACLGVSTILCSWALWHLCRGWRRVSSRIFWSQLVALTISNLLFAVLCLAFRSLYLAGFIPHTKPSCAIALHTQTFLEFLSCLIEVHISAGFAAACSRRVWVWRGLWCTLPACVLLAAVLVILVDSETALSTLNPLPYGCQYRQDTPHFRRWGCIVIGCGLAALFCYIISIGATKGMPPLMRKRALLRGLTYVGNFLLTFLLPAVWEVTSVRSRQRSIVDVATSNVLALNGAANAATYGFWMLHAKWLQDRAANNGSIGAVEDILIDRYFDFSTLTADDLACQAQEQAIFAVAEARRLRQ
mmetsp:Transcript_60308/g.111871  ORF Transcript_60308/g.111871 Transcript_60308/m.111871 type:complete len:323 (-) Transcript_60308:113-1081(-)